MLKPKIKIAIGLVIAVVISVWMGARSGAINGIFYFFILTFLVWATAKARRWI